MPRSPANSHAPPTPEAPASASGRNRRGLLVGAVAASLAAGVVAHNTRATIKMRDDARALKIDLPHGASVGSGLGNPLRLWVIGDSAAAGYGLTDAREAFPFQVASQLASETGKRVEVDTLATDGHTTHDVRTQQLWKLRKRAPDVVVVNVGVNDAIKRTPIATVRDETDALLREATEMLPATTIVLVGCPDLRNAPGLPRPLNLVVGMACRRVARAQADVAANHAEVVRFAPIATPPEARHFGPDGFHPGAEGQHLMAALAVEAIVHHVVAV